MTGQIDPSFGDLGCHDKMIYPGDLYVHHEEAWLSRERISLWGRIRKLWIYFSLDEIKALNNLPLRRHARLNLTVKKAKNIKSKVTLRFRAKLMSA